MIELLTSADGSLFRQLFAIYAASITPREQKPEEWLRAMVVSPEYRVSIAQTSGRVLGFSILFVPPGGGFTLLEYMAVTPEKRGNGFGGELFRRTVEHSKAPDGGRLPAVLEIDSDREASADQAMRTRRANFYRRLGCVKIAGLEYQMPLQGTGAPPEMDLMIHRTEPVAPLARGELQRWLQIIYRDVYHCSPDDPRIAAMVGPLRDPVAVE